MQLGRQARSLPATPFSPEYSLSHCLWARPERKSFFKLRFKSEKIHLLLLKISIFQIALDVDMTSVDKGNIVVIFFTLALYLTDMNILKQRMYDQIA